MTGPLVAWTALGLSILASVAGQTLLKAGASATTFWAQLLEPRSIAGLAAYGLAAFFYMRALRDLPISVALPVTGVTYLAAALVGALLFGERLAALQFAGIALICAGVGLLVGTVGPVR